MKIFRAVATNKITQKFGENKNSIYKKWGLLGHGGIDWSAKDGEEVVWDCDCYGKVIALSTDENEGLGVVVITDDKDGIFKHHFWHLKDMTVKVGQIVGTGEVLGHADNTGYSTGTHLHRDLKPQVYSSGTYKNKDYNNGYAGGIDYAPYLENIYAKDLMANLQAQVSILTKVVLLIKQLILWKR